MAGGRAPYSHSERGIVILNEVGAEVQVELGTTVASLPKAWRRATLSRR
jgi:hypothetical protein